MYQHRTLLAVLAVPLAVATVSVAQAPPPAEPGMQREMAPQTDHSLVRASKLIGLKVYNGEDKHLGEIKDVVLSSDGQHLGYAVISYGGFLGLGNKLFAIPYRDVAYSGPKDSKAYVRLDEATLKAAPGFDPDRWPEKADATGYYSRVNEYYRTNTTARPAGARMDTDTGAAATPMAEGLTWDRRLSAVIGARVESPDEQKLGDIKDVVVDWNTGRVQYDVLSFGGIVGIGDKLFAIPSEALKPKPDSKEFVLATDRERLKAAPGFDKENWPDFADTKWWQTNDQFYKTQP